MKSIKRLLELIVAGDLCHGDNRILTWMASNVVLLTNAKNEKRLAKERAPEKIDGIAAICNLVDVALVRAEKSGPSVYEIERSADFGRRG